MALTLSFLFFLAMGEENPRRGRKKRVKEPGERGERVKEEIKRILTQDVGEEVLRELTPLLELSDEEI